MVIKLAIKTAIASGAVYYTNQLEVWGPLSAEPVAYDRAIADVKGYANQLAPQSLSWPKVVNSGDLCSLTNHYYNTAVISTFDYLASLPCNLTKLYGSAADKIKQINGQQINDIHK